MLAHMPERPDTRPNPSLIAVRPDINATVSASAGSGKTWLLVTRILRLLLAGAEPGTILALTFTRKAAAEMQLRLRDRLYQMATVDDADLKSLLQEIEADTSSETQVRARGLYELLLHALYPVRLRTFHSFCQDILARFPLEADIPPGFELLEDTSLLVQQAWEALFAEATRAPDGELATALDVLMIAANGPANTHSALFSMLDHRSDWWAYTENQKHPVVFARREIEKHLQFDTTSDPLAVFFNDFMRHHLREFAILLRKHSNATNEKHAALIDTVSERVEFDLSDFAKLRVAFLTVNNTPRARKSSKSQQKSMGIDAETRFLELHEQICNQLLTCIEQQLRQQCYQVNTAWYYAGECFIEIFQRLKREQRLLDFTDLEWNCYQLLNTSDNALWVQYKIDQHIDHILIDEFQDTNPTQWQLLAPLLEEMAASKHERWRSVFLVGDEKQSIYAFRRANPALQSQASAWLGEHLAAVATPLDFSWRSSPAIIDFVNAVFSNEEVRQQLPGFSLHDTHRKSLPGVVTLMPLFHQDEIEAIPQTGLRNPILQPRPPAPPSAHDREAEWLAAEIMQLVRSGRVGYGDILILSRNRSHSEAYENALRRRQIPFIGNQRGSLLHNLEIQDMEKLLDTLITPFDNLALAQVLKSPIFAASDDDLMHLASLPGQHRWYPRLLLLAETLEHDHPLQRAARLLQSWRALADTVPVHDLLDRIFAEGNIIARYVASLPADQQQRVEANLRSFLELSLDIDSGRYPSLTHFLHRLRNLRRIEDSAPDEPVNSSPDCVRFLTIHASKGLESPVVFLVDCNSAGGHHDAYSALVDWPADRVRPSLFQLTMSRANSDSISSAYQEKKSRAQERENLNLLYVALTRARQFLYISGASSNRPGRWQALLETGMRALGAGDHETTMRHSVGNIDTATGETGSDAGEIEKTAFDSQLLAQLRLPIARMPRPAITLAPSHSDDASRPGLNLAVGDVDGRLRGQVIHRALELLCTRSLSEPALNAQLATEFALSNQDGHLQDWCQEARATISAPALREVFHPPQDAQVFNECPILYRHGEQDVYGIIDRLVVNEKELLVIDYKSHQFEDPSHAPAIAQQFSEQLDLYRDGVRRLWPDHDVRTGVVFTAHPLLVWLQ